MAVQTVEIPQGRPEENREQLFLRERLKTGVEAVDRRDDFKRDEIDRYDPAEVARIGFPEGMPLNRDMMGRNVLELTREFYRNRDPRTVPWEERRQFANYVRFLESTRRYVA
jgi:hypothetical protein